MVIVMSDRSGDELDRCRLCGSEDELDFHHWRYEDDTGCPLCRDCHSHIHEPEGGRPGEGPGNEWMEVALPRLVERHMRYNVLLTSGRLIAQHYNIPVKHQQRIIEIVENHAE